MRRTQIALALFVFLLVMPSVTGLAMAVGWNLVLAALGVLLVGVLVASAVAKHYYPTQGNGRDEGFWGFVPSWQYEGRFAEAGGLTQSEQSEAIGKVQKSAKEAEENRR